MTHRRMFFLASIVPFILFLDRYTKQWALDVLADRDKILFPGCTLSLSLNRGISWSLFSFSSPFLFWMLTLFIIIILCWFTYIAFQPSYLSEATEGKLLVVAGATSNIIDRFLYGGVVDFIDCSLGSWHWPSFNCADCAIVLGIGLIIGRMYYDRLFSKHA